MSDEEMLGIVSRHGSYEAVSGQMVRDQEALIAEVRRLRAENTDLRESVRRLQVDIKAMERVYAKDLQRIAAIDTG